MPVTWRSASLTTQTKQWSRPRWFDSPSTSKHDYCPLKHMLSTLHTTTYLCSLKTIYYKQLITRQETSLGRLGVGPVAQSCDVLDGIKIILLARPSSTTTKRLSCICPPGQVHKTSQVELAGSGIPTSSSSASWSQAVTAAGVGDGFWFETRGCIDWYISDKSWYIG